MSSLTAPEWVSWLAENRLHRLVPLYRFGYISGARSRLGRGALLASACIDPIEEAAIKPSSPQLDEPRRGRMAACGGMRRQVPVALAVEPALPARGEDRVRYRGGGASGGAGAGAPGRQHRGDRGRRLPQQQGARGARRRARLGQGAAVALP